MKKYFKKSNMDLYAVEKGFEKDIIMKEHNEDEEGEE